MNARLAPKWQRVSAWGGSVLCFLLLSTGCQSVDPSVELLESELRWLEDQLYLLDDQLEQKSAELESCRRYNQSLEAERIRGSSSSDSDDSGGIGSILRNRSDDDYDDSGYGDDSDASDDGRDADDDADDDEINLQPPQIDDGVEGMPNIEVTFPDEGAAVPPRLETDEHKAWPTEQYEDSSMSAGLNGGQLRVSQIVLNSRLTGGYDFDGQPGDEGLLVVIEPRDASGKYVPLPAPVSVEVFDENERIARWDFDISETTSKMRTTLLGRGIHLELPWPIQPPSNTQLRVVAKYDDFATRRELIAKRTVRVDLMPNAQRMFVGPAPLQLPSDRGVADSFATEPMNGLPVSVSSDPAVSGWTKRKSGGGFSAAKEPRGKTPEWSPMR